MASEALLKYGTTQLLFADHATDFGAGPTTAVYSLIIGTPADVQFDLTSVAANGGARMSAKSGDLGATRAPIYRVDACLEFATAPADGGSVDFYWGGSHSSTSNTANGGGITGSDAAYTDTPGLLGQLNYIGTLKVRNSTINIGYVGYFVAEHRYGSLVMVNNASTALAADGNMDETHITATPIIHEGQ
jgi:hypothetical protein